MLELAAVCLSLVGLAGTVVPGLPGALLILATAVGYAWATGFQGISTGVLWMLGGIGVTSQAVDFFVAAFGTRRAGASRAAMVGAIIGAVIGTLLLGPVGLLAGPFLGAFGGELLQRRSVNRAGRVGFAAATGAIVGLGLNLVLGVIMVAVFWWAIFT